MQLPFVRLLVSKISKEQANLRSHLRTINAVFILVCLYCTDDKWPKTFDLCLVQSKIPGMDTHNHSGLQKKKEILFNCGTTKQLWFLPTRSLNHSNRQNSNETAWYVSATGCLTIVPMCSTGALLWLPWTESLPLQRRGQYCDVAPCMVQSSVNYVATMGKQLECQF